MQSPKQFECENELVSNCKPHDVKKYDTFGLQSDPQKKGHEYSDEAYLHEMAMLKR